MIKRGGEGRNVRVGRGNGVVLEEETSSASFLY